MQPLAAGALHSFVAILMPGLTASLRAPEPFAEAPEPSTVGEHLIQRQRVLGHRTVDSARIIGTNRKSLVRWERIEREPLDRSSPAIMAYLRYATWQEPHTLREQLLAERRRGGLPIYEAAAATCVDETTAWWWESGTGCLAIAGPGRLSRPS